MKFQRGSVLVALLWCLALLSVLVIGLLHVARLDLLVVKNHGDLIQAHYLALAGIEKAKALLYEDAKGRRRSGVNHTGALYDSPESFRDIPFGRGQFRVMRQRPGEPERLMYGVNDEESRLNFNTASAEELGRLEGIRPEIAAAILDWRDPDRTPLPGGAETEYYSSLRPPYQPRNGPFQTTRELLMVAGVTRELLLGEDVNQNGLLDPAEDDGAESYPPDNRDGVLDAGWSGVLTLDSGVANTSATGRDRVDLQSADEATLTGVQGITPELARAIIAYRGQNRFESLADLLEVTAVNPANQPGPNPPGAPPGGSPGPRPAGPPGGPGPSNPARTAPSSGRSGSSPAPTSPPAGAPGRGGSQPGGPKLIDERLLMEIADEVTTLSNDSIPGAININTAGPSVLVSLPGVTRELAQAIISYRKSTGFFPNIAWLLKVDGMTREIFKQIAPKITTRSETFRILSEGQVKSSGARKRIEVIVRVGSRDVETLAYRENL